MATDQRPKAIYLHLKNDTDESIKTHLALAERIFPTHAWTTARAWYAEKISAAGGWAEWEALTARNFDTFAISQRTLGKATANIVRLALNKAVVLIEDKIAHRVTGVTTVDSKNWQAGWQVVLEEEQDF